MGSERSVRGGSYCGRVEGKGTLQIPQISHRSGGGESGRGTTGHTRGEKDRRQRGERGKGLEKKRTVANSVNRHESTKKKSKRKAAKKTDEGKRS